MPQPLFPRHRWLRAEPVAMRRKRLLLTDLALLTASTWIAMSWLEGEVARGPFRSMSIAALGVGFTGVLISRQAKDGPKQQGVRTATQLMWQAVGSIVAGMSLAMSAIVGGSSSGVLIGRLMAAVLCLATAWTAWWLRVAVLARERSDSGRCCDECGYDLTGAATRPESGTECGIRCPECGKIT